MRKPGRLYWRVTTAALLVAAAFQLAPTPLRDAVNNLLFDQYQRWRPRAYDFSQPVRIVDIDDESIRRFGQWPWPRERLAELSESLGKAEVAAVAFDLLFADPERPDKPGAESGDAHFARAIQATPTALGAYFTEEPGGAPLPAKAAFAQAGDDPAAFLPRFTRAVAPLPTLSDHAAGLGFLNWLPDGDRIVRRVPLVAQMQNTPYPSLAMEALRLAQGASTLLIKSSNASGETAFGVRTGIVAIKNGAVQIPTDSAGDVRVYYARHDLRRTIPAWKIFEPEADLSDLQGKIVFVGASAALLSDIVGTPLNAATPGVEVHAQIVEQILDGATLTRPDWAPGAEFFALVFLGLALLFAMPRISARHCALAAAAGVAALAAASWLAFSRAGLLLDPVFPSLSTAGVLLAGVSSLYGEKRRQEQEIRGAFGRFVAPAVVERLATMPDALRLGGQQRLLTLMFCDLRSFTTLSEGFNAHDLTHFLNDYLTPMTDIILDRLGVVDKYMGDAIMAFWNAPLDDADHARHAAQAALAMREALAAFNRHCRAEPPPYGRMLPEIRFGIGLNTGECCVGNLGSVRRFDYSALGDEVNVAARLESSSKIFGVDIVATRPTRDAVSDWAWLEVDEVTFKNKTQPVTVFALVGDANLAQTEGFRALKALHEAMLDDYRARRFEQAADKARLAAPQAPEVVRGLYDFHFRRFRALTEQQMVADWRPVLALDEK